MMRFLLTSAVLMGGALVAQPALADHGYYGGRACYRPPVHHHHHQRHGAYYAPYRHGNYGYNAYRYNAYSPYAAHNRYRQYHYGHGYGGARGGVSLYGPRGGFSVRF